MRPHPPNRAAPVSGFTLVELLVVIAIVIALTILAAPAWQRHVERGWRMQARAELVSAMLVLERHALVHLTFASAADGTTPAGEWPKPVPPPPAQTRHWLTATSCDGIALSRCVEVRAAPVRPDPVCGTLALRSSGEWLSLPTPDGAAMPLPPGC
ncbi:MULTISPECIES: pilus assembly protein PilE [unclassified Cupriavidus]|uniref:type IV pilin protein n=1 Tax=unclassified Cupriavidus TaxID=2640874 RepID=UPI001C001C19|nr:MULTISPECIES: pilus assembly protein PilE [unclassified Cupriavidus]MCA3192798.1 pilus assembly protein PilE [Cupriavidus sp.]MCA3194999.1 pilus assembly protein PilE [Cupriavidus sp.]MCA3203969.1 pilus assembly protein PilE [Cupriavidus sp.]MCA3205728.1 pilus assembly protein PilE [Cupriavidus sp.]MCA3234072.1 pilus assembly protein PilE [Cupriavidus sp.]